MVLLGAVVLTLAIGDHPDAIVVALVVVVNTTVGVAQEVRADNAVAALSALSAPHARVRRDGAVRDLLAARLLRTAFRAPGPAGTAGASGLP
ncbi:hypothetical protein SVTN_00115 [Streptomyces vietnamensis]|uniref:Cation-transporting P-type ATPase N-terminal domain-containing protein n=2 Tax=Streptomyces vietnamensis TaxID=362257 RepID=A0A0B5HXZ4_9ACTN|nr:hypothetical protein SVTN_00115 [Streptomyces vietnamensis]